MTMKLDLVGSASDWIKYSDYDYKESKAGDLYIVPTNDARFKMYNPFNLAEDLLIDVINLGDMVLKYEKEENDENKEKLYNKLMIFTKKYGLMGFISSSVYNRNIIGDEVILFNSNNFVSDKKMTDEESYLKQFIPFIKKGEVQINRYNNSVDVKKSEDSPKYHGKRPLVLDLIFSKFYTEKANWILSFAKLISSHFNQLLIYKKTKNHLTENVTIMAGEFQPQKISFTVEQLDKTTISWQFDSLKTAIETIYAFAITDETSLIDRCVYCNKVFIANNTRKKYCSNSCRNRANVEKSRKRNKNNN